MSLEEIEFIKCDISSENTDTFKFLLEIIKWDKILHHVYPHETFHFIFSDLYDKEKQRNRN